MECEVTCGVCSEVYGPGEGEPVILPGCGHAFCRGCLRGVAEAGAGVTCPTCRTPHEGHPPHTLPPAFSLLNIALHYARTQSDGTMEECGVHGRQREFWCRVCCEALCGHCLLEAHVLEGHLVQPAHQVVMEQQREVRQRGRQLLVEVRRRQEVLTASLTHLLARLARVAQASQSLSAAAARTITLLHQASAATTLEPAFLTTSLMESLQADVAKMELEAGESKRQLRGRCASCSQASNPAQFPSWVEVSQESPSGLQSSEITEASRQDSVWEEVEANDTEKHPGLPVPHPQRDTAHLHQQGECNLVREEAEDEEENPINNFGRPVRCFVKDGQGRRGVLRWEGGRLQIYALTLHPHNTDDYHITHPDDHRDSHTPDHHTHRDIIIQLPLVEFLIPRDAPVVFLDIRTKERCLGRVYLRLWGHLRRAQHFLALCTGSRGPSYRGGMFHGVAKRGADGETLAGGRYLTGDGGTSVKGVMGGLEWGGEYAVEKREGLVVGASGGRPDLDAFFHICTRPDSKGRFGCAFGEVVDRKEDTEMEQVENRAGMEVLRAAVSHLSSESVYIADCGLVLHPPDL